MTYIAANVSEVRDWNVYKITNPSGRVYIGVTCDIKGRKNDYEKHNCKHQTAIQRSLDKHSFILHSFDILESFTSTNSYAMDKEMFWIRTYMSNAGKYPSMNGLNMNDGGRVGIGRVVSKETKEKLRAANLGKKASQATKDKLSIRSRANPFRRTFSEEQKKQMSEIKKGFKHTDEAKRKISEAGKGNQYNRGKKQTPERIEKTRQLHLGNKYSLGRVQSLEERINRGIRFKKAVLQFSLSGEFIKEHSSIKEAAIETGVSKYTIWASSKGIHKPKLFNFKIKTKCH